MFLLLFLFFLCGVSWSRSRWGGKGEAWGKGRFTWSFFIPGCFAGFGGRGGEEGVGRGDGLLLVILVIFGSSGEGERGVSGGEEDEEEGRSVDGERLVGSEQRSSGGRSWE